MSETSKPTPKEITTQMAVASMLVALTDVLLTIQDLPPQVELQLLTLRRSGNDSGEIYREALKLSAICETAKRDIGR